MCLHTSPLDLAYSFSFSLVCESYFDFTCLFSILAVPAFCPFLPLFLLSFLPSSLPFFLAPFLPPFLLPLSLVHLFFPSSFRFFVSFLTTRLVNLLLVCLSPRSDYVPFVCRASQGISLCRDESLVCGFWPELQREVSHRNGGDIHFYR